MPQYGVLVYLPAPADPAALPADYLAALADYPERAAGLGGKVLGARYFSNQRGFAFESGTTAVAVVGGTARPGHVAHSDLVPAAFYVVSAPSLEVAVEIARAHPAARTGGLEVRPLFAPAKE